MVIVQGTQPAENAVLTNSNNNNNNNNVNNVNTEQIGINVVLRTQTVAEQFNVPNNNYYAMASVCASAVPIDPEKQKAPLNVITVLDVSGSMAGDRIKLLKETMELLIGELRPIDSLGIVTFSNTSTTLLPLTLMDANGKSKALDRMSYANASGSTFLSAGLQSGLELLPRASNLDNINTVLLLTDGQANKGISTAVGINEMVKEFVKESGLKFTIYTFGYCKGHEASFLKEIADNTEGTYYFIENTDQIKDSFADCMAGLLSIVGQQVQLTITASEGHQIQEVLTKFQVEELEAKKKFRVTFGDLQSEENRDVPFVVSLPAMDGTVPSDPVLVATTSLKYFNVITNKMDSFEYMLTLNRVTAEETSLNQESDPLILANVYRVTAVRIMQEAAKLAEAGKFDEGRNLLEKCLSEICASSVASLPEILLLTNSIRESMNSMVSKVSYANEGGYMIQQCMHSLGMQRNNNICQKFSGVSYENSPRKAMKSKWAKY